MSKNTPGPKPMFDYINEPIKLNDDGTYEKVKPYDLYAAMHGNPMVRTKPEEEVENISGKNFPVEKEHPHNTIELTITRDEIPENAVYLNGRPPRVWIDGIIYRIVSRTGPEIDPGFSRFPEQWSHAGQDIDPGFSRGAERKRYPDGIGEQKYDYIEMEAKPKSIWDKIKKYFMYANTEPGSGVYGSSEPKATPYFANMAIDRPAINNKNMSSQYAAEKNASQVQTSVPQSDVFLSIGGKEDSSSTDKTSQETDSPKEEAAQEYKGTRVTSTKPMFEYINDPIKLNDDGTYEKVKPYDLYAAMHAGPENMTALKKEREEKAKREAGWQDPAGLNGKIIG